MVVLSKKMINTLLFFIFVLFTTLSSLFGDNSVFKMRYIIGIFILFVLIYDKRLSFRLSKETLVFFSVYLFLGVIPASVINGNVDWRYGFVQLMYVTVSYFMLEYDISELSMNILLWIMHILFLIALITGRGLVNISTNYISVIYIVIFCIYMVLCDKNKAEMNKQHIYCGFVLSVVAGGRGGIICMGIVVGGVIFSEKNRNKWLIFIFIVVMGGAVLATNSNYMLSMFHNFAEKGMNSNGRMIFWKNYLEQCSNSVRGILWGCNIKENLSRYYYNINHLHNSYITLYGNIGLIAFSYVMYKVFKETIVIWKKSKKVLFIILVAFFIRAFTDIVFAGYMGEIVIYYLIWQGIKEKKD